MNRIKKLLFQLCPNGVEYKKLREVCDILRGKRLTKKELNDNEMYPVFHGGIEPLGYYKDFNRKTNMVMIINTGSIGKVDYSFKKFWSSDGTFTIDTPNYLNDRFLYFILKCYKPYLKTQKREGGVPTITISRYVISNLLILIPPLPIR